jgi:hypothetical protein
VSAAVEALSVDTGGLRSVIERADPGNSFQEFTTVG